MRQPTREPGPVLVQKEHSGQVLDAVDLNNGVTQTFKTRLSPVDADPVPGSTTVDRQIVVEVDEVQDVRECGTPDVRLGLALVFPQDVEVVAARSQEALARIGATDGSERRRTPGGTETFHLESRSETGVKFRGEIYTVISICIGVCVLSDGLGCFLFLLQ